MAERKVSVRLSVVDGGQFKAELAELGASGNQALGAIGSGAANAGKAVQLNAQQLANLNYQISDIGVSLASGQNPFTVMLQQGAQIVQMFGPGTGILGALRAVGTGLITFLTNPLNLALLGFSAVTAAAGYFFSAVAGPGEDANKTLEQQEDILGRIAGKYGEALPQVQRYADEIDRANRSAELADAHVAAIDRAWREAMQGFEAAQGEIFDTYAILESIGAIDSIATLQHAIWDLQAALKTNTATAEEAQRIHDMLMKVFQETGIPVTETLANRFAALVGCDCAGLARGIWRELVGAEPASIPAYSRDWGEVGARETFADFVRPFLIEIDPAEAGPGSLLLFRMRRKGPAKHCGVLLDDGTFIHALERRGVATVAYDTTWARRTAFAFLFPAGMP